MKYGILLVVVWVIYAILNVCIAAWNDDTRRKRIKAGNTKQIEHPLYAIMYGALVFPIWLLYKDWWLVASISLLHVSVFPVAYNRFSDLPAFNLSKTTTAITDTIMRKLGFKSTETVNILAFALSITLLILSITQ